MNTYTQLLGHRAKMDLLIFAICLLTITSNLTVARTYGVMNPGDSMSLVMTNEDMPWDVLLTKYATGSSVGLVSDDLDRPSAVFIERWAGQLSKKEDQLPRPICTVVLMVSIMDSHEQAFKFAEMEIHSYSQTMQEASEQQYKGFSDKAWYGCTMDTGEQPKWAGLKFVRDNVFASIALAHTDGVDPRLLFAMTAKIGNRIDMAVAGKPYPPTVLPPSLEDMKIGLEEAWAIRKSAKAFGKSNNIYFKNGKKVPRALLAQKTSSGKYLVPLSYLAGIMGTKSKPKLSGQNVSANIAGKTVVFTKGSSKSKINGKSVDLGAKVEIRNGQAFVPLSFLEKGLNKKIAWGNNGKTLTATIK